jgi:hypothetical protein
MKTDDWIEVLAAGATPVPTHALERRFGGAVAAGVGGAVLLMLLVFGLRADLVQTMALPMFWAKLAFAAALAVPGVWVLQRMARPGARWSGLAWSLALPVAVLWAMAAWALLQQAPADRWAVVLGSTWRTCPFNIALLSLPAFVASFWALRGAAPTRPAWAGAGAGLLAGALGALVYAFHCPEMASPFLAVWYVAGIALPTALGAALGPRLLRW